MPHLKHQGAAWQCLGCGWVRFIILGCNSAAFGGQSLIQFTTSGSFYNTGVQLCLRYMKLRSSFCHISDIREQLLGLWLLNIYHLMVKIRAADLQYFQCQFVAMPGT